MTAIKENQRFEVGDWIVHYYHGVGKVEDIVEKGLDGNQKLYYKVSTKKIDYWIPMEDQGSEHIEPIRSKADFEKALKLIEKKPIPIAEHHKSRKKKIHDRWMIGSLESRAALLRDLYGRLKLEKLSFSEKEMMEKVRNYFISEWLITDQKLTRTQARKKLREALKSSVEKGRKARKKEEEKE
jgi:RNA polymerase-interacting CarD/CdnL/TRCF family regulator